MRMCGDLAHNPYIAWRAARRYWVSATYRFSVKYWHLFLDSFCSFFLIFLDKSGSVADSFSFLDFIFILFYTRLHDFSLTIVNCKCFVSPEDWTSWTSTTFWLQKYKIILNSAPFFSFFVQNEFDFNKKLKLHIYFILSIKRETVDSIFAGLSLSLDMLIYIIKV